MTLTLLGSSNDWFSAIKLIVGISGPGQKRKYPHRKADIERAESVKPNHLSGSS
jgi:hypothetical protein